MLSNWLAVVARMPPVTWRVEEGEVLPMPTEPVVFFTVSQLATLFSRIVKSPAEG